VKGWAVGARAGLLVGGALVYATGGWTDVNAKVAGFSTDADGWLLGAGGEFELGNGVFLRGEVRHTWLDVDVTTWDADETSGRLGLVYKINWSPVDLPKAIK